MASIWITCPDAETALDSPTFHVRVDFDARVDGKELTNVTPKCFVHFLDTFPASIHTGVENPASSKRFKFDIAETSTGAVIFAELWAGSPQTLQAVSSPRFVTVVAAGSDPCA
jgi:hypothetical protein